MTIIRVPVKINFPQDGGPGYNIWHVRTADDDPGTWELDGALDALETFYNAVKTYMPGVGSIIIGEGMIGDPLGSPFYVDDDSRTISIPLGTDPQPSMVAVAVSWRTTSATRSGRGRTFVGPLGTNTLQSDGTVATAALTAIRNAAIALVTSSTGMGGWSVGVLSVKEGIFRDVTGSSVRDRFAVLTSRRP